MTPSKELLEAASPAIKTAAAPPKHDLNRLRADAVSLDVPVKVHGSRVTDVVRGVTPHTEPFEEETSTMIVFPQGGVVRMATAVSVGQMLVLTNQRTNQDAICRVVKVRAYSNTQAYVEVEFTHRQAGYWGVHFPADEEESPSTAAPAAVPAPEPVQKRIDAPVVSSVIMKVEGLPKAPTPPARNESAFVSIGSQEQVQPSAASMELKHRVAPVAPAAAPQVHASAPIAPAMHATPLAPAYVPPTQARVVPSCDLVEPAPSQFEDGVEAEPPHSSRSFGTLTGGSAATAQGAMAADSAAWLDSEVSPQAQPAAPRGNNWMWVAACAFFLVAGLSAGALYFRQHPFAAPGKSAASQDAASSAPAAQPNQSSAASAATASQPAESVAERPSHAPIQAPTQESPETQPRAANAPSSREARPAPAPAASFATSNARPVARRTGVNAETAAPSVAAGASASGSVLPDVLNASNDAPPPPPLERVHVGGLIVQPKLVHSVPPNYPPSARQAGIAGNVVINAQIDKQGNVASMKVLSGPATLQAAALIAMKQWKYQPATLDASPISTEVTVTIKFQQP